MVLEDAASLGGARSRGMRVHGVRITLNRSEVFPKSIFLHIICLWIHDNFQVNIILSCRKLENSILLRCRAECRIEDLDLEEALDGAPLPCVQGYLAQKKQRDPPDHHMTLGTILL